MVSLAGLHRLSYARVNASCASRHERRSVPEGRHRDSTGGVAGERANAQLKTWHILGKLRCCPWRAGQLAQAIHVLQTHGA